MKSLSILLFFSLTICLKLAFVQSQKKKDHCDQYEEICGEKKNCIDCIQAHECCHFCYDKEYLNATTKQCQTKSKLSPSCKQVIENFKATLTATANETFRDNNENDEAIQIKPQKINIKLHQNKPFNFTFTYKPAKNYLLDLYFLTDITTTMSKSLEDMSKLSNELSNTLDSLTSRYRIAFGTYMDKIEMPFYPTDEDNIDNPCKLFAETCSKGIFFKHALNFTNDISQFIQQVNSTTTSANLDDMEGGFDALMQVLLCNETLGWGQSRKIVLFVTGSFMHFAGDGIMAGAVRRNRKQCLINANGDYTAPHNFYDYPSLEEVHNEMVEKKINLIIASQESSYDYYEQMRELTSNNTYLGKLGDTSDVTKHIKDGYHKFIEEVVFSPVFANNSKDVQIKFFSKCNGKEMKETSKCDEIKENEEIEFIAEIVVTSKFPSSEKYKLRIEEKNIAEYIEVEIETIEVKCQTCDVEKIDCIHGMFDCCQCVCDKDWTGSDCSKECQSDVNLCRDNSTGVLKPTCSGYTHGECSCGKCHCFEPYKGKFCQYVCPIDPVTHRICGGLNNGHCSKDTCICEPNFTGEFCTCSTLQTNCKITESGECNGFGSCKCNKCKCEEGFSGDFCEICDRCSKFCELYEPCIEEHLANNSVTNCVIERIPIPIEKVDKFSGNIYNKTCIHGFKNKENRTCQVQFGYELSPSATVKLQVLPFSCTSAVASALIALPIFGAILFAGIIAIVVIKLRNGYLDHVEYTIFMNQQKFKTEGTNPLYKEVKTHYSVPESVKFSE